MPHNPNLRIVMAHPPRSNGLKKEPGKVCALRRAMPRDKSSNQSWDARRDYWLTNWGWTKVLDEPSMFVTKTKRGVARMEADNDDFFITAPTDDDLDLLSKTLEEVWQVTTQKLSAGHTLEKLAKSEHGPPQSNQHVGLKISRLPGGGIKISNSKIIQKILKENGFDGANSLSAPCVISADLTARKEHEPTVDVKQYMGNAGSLRFIVDTTHPDIFHIVGIIGRHLHDPSPRHVEALKPIYRYLSSRFNGVPVYDKQGPPDFTCYTDSDYSGCTDIRRYVSGIFCWQTVNRLCGERHDRAFPDTRQQKRKSSRWTPELEISCGSPG